MKKNRRRNIRNLSLGIAACIIAFSAFSFFFSQSDFEPGIAYLKAQSEKEITELKEQIEKEKMARLVEAIDAGQSDIFQFFNDSVFFGDSRVEGFKAYGFLPQERVLAELGYTINNIPEYYDNIEHLNPQYMFFSYGANDIGHGIGADRGENGYAQVFEEYINQLLERSPRSKVVINSIIPATPAAVAAEPMWNELDHYNGQLKEMCERNHWIYVDNSALAQDGNMAIYEPDGIHFLSGFYPLWAMNNYQKIQETSL